VRFVGFERDLQNSVSQTVAVQAGDGHGRLVVVGHSDKTESFALARVKVADDLDVGHRPERPKHLPQDALVGVGRQVVDEDAPAGAGVPRDVDASQAGHPVDGHGREPAAETQQRTEFKTGTGGGADQNLLETSDHTPQGQCNLTNVDRHGQGDRRGSFWKSVCPRLLR